ncbi:MAG: hypothetical protein H6Q90_1696 [Deltaproteobacteria bacterium]|nr:hypothetical protein [Deltaproteobacteria bacterium]
MRQLVVTLCCLVACGGPGTPAPTETVCPDPDPNTLTYDNFGMQFMSDYCIQCHDSGLVRSERNGAPLYHDFDSLLGVVQVANHIDEQAGFGAAAENTFMPPSRCPSVPGGKLDRDCKRPSDDERRKLAEWIACELGRPHTF